jgi:hypothetical protein
MFVRLVRNIFSVVAGASVTKQCQAWEVAQSQPLLLVIQLSSLKQWIQAYTTSVTDSNNSILFYAKTTKAFKQPGQYSCLHRQHNGSIQFGIWEWPSTQSGPPTQASYLSSDGQCIPCLKVCCLYHVRMLRVLLSWCLHITNNTHGILVRHISMKI